MLNEGFLAPRLYIDNDSGMGYYAVLVESTREMEYYVPVNSVKGSITIVPLDEI